MLSFVTYSCSSHLLNVGIRVGKPDQKERPDSEAPQLPHQSSGAAAQLSLKGQALHLAGCGVWARNKHVREAGEDSGLVGLQCPEGRGIASWPSWGAIDTFDS